jgi:hypothetical protein
MMDEVMVGSDMPIRRYHHDGREAAEIRAYSGMGVARETQRQALQAE